MFILVINTHIKIENNFFTLQIFISPILASFMAQRVKNLPAMWETGVRSLGWEHSPGEEKGTHSCILAWRIP